MAMTLGVKAMFENYGLSLLSTSSFPFCNRRGKEGVGGGTSEINVMSEHFGI